MRLALAAAAVAALSLTTAAQAAPPRQSLVLPHGLIEQETATGGALYYRADSGRRQVVNRLDLTTGQETTVYRVARRHTVDKLRAGAGRVALQVDDENPRGGFLSRVIELDPAGGPPRTLLRGVYRNLKLFDCGKQVQLEAGSQDGALLTGEIRYPCRSQRRTTQLLRRWGAGGPDFRLRADRWLDRDPRWRLAGDWVLVTADGDLRVRNLATGARRRLRVNQRRHRFGFADLDAAGNVAAEQHRFRRRSFHERLRLVTPADPATGGRVLFDSIDAESEPRFCGSRLVEHRTAPDRHELLVYDDLAGPARVAFSAPGRHDQAGVVCDADTAVITEGVGPTSTAVEVVPLAP